MMGQRHEITEVAGKTGIVMEHVVGETLQAVSGTRARAKDM